MSHEPNKKVRDGLWAWGNTANLIRRKEREIQGYAERLSDATDVQVHLKSQWASSMPGSKVPHGSVVEWAIENAEARKEQYKQAMENLHQDIESAMEFKRKIDGALETLGAQEMRVIELRYLKKHPWQFIGTIEGRSERWARITEVEAIKKLLCTSVFCRFDGVNYRR